MIHKYNEEKPILMTLILSGGKTITGEFFDGIRFDTDSIPNGKVLYRTRHGETDWSGPISISPKAILVNFCGSFVTDKNIGITKETDIIDYSYGE